MHDRLDICRLACRRRLDRPGRRGRLIAYGAIVGGVIVWLAGRIAVGQDAMMMPPEEMDGAAMEGWDPGAPPMTSMGEGSFYSQDLGTMLRARWSTRSYGQDDQGNLDIGTMQVLSFEDAIAFFDGQVTLNDQEGVGFNLGLGYRWLTYDRILGASIWGDGSSTEAGNFFPQLGISLESLGELWDLRANGYIPIGQDTQVGNFVPTGEIGFQDHFISELAVATVDQSFYAAELEVARRLGHERDAWAFAGPYVLANDIEDTAGYRAGFRGYAYPDLLLQIAVSNDDIYDTNTTFSVTWFIGRTRTNFHPACGVPDRFREPVMRNDYVVLSRSTALGGTPLTDADTDEAFRVTHVDSDAPAGGDGTFERPLNNLDDIQGNSLAGDIVYVHALSEFDGQSAVLQANQRFLGEGNGIEHLIDTVEVGEIPIPETFAGATNATRPEISNSPGAAVTVDDLNEVSNFTIEGGTNAIVAGPNGAGNPNIHDLNITGTTGDAIVLTPLVRTDTNDEDDDGNTTERTVAFNVNIQDVTFENIGGDEINLDADTIDVTQPDVTLQEAIVVMDIVSTGGGGRGLVVRNTHDTGTLALTNYMNTGSTVAAVSGKVDFADIAGDVTMNNVDITGGTGYALAFLNVEDTSAVTVTGLDFDGLTGAAGALLANAYDGTFNISSSTLENGTLDGVSLLGATDGSFTFANTVTMTNLGNVLNGIAFEIDGGALNEFTGSVTVNNAIANDLGQSVVLRNMGTGSGATFVGNITDTGQGIRVDDNADGVILFSGLLDLDTSTNTAVLITDNTGADISFAGQVDIDTTTGDGFVATGGGTLTASNTNNSVTTAAGGRLINIDGMTIAAGTGVNFDEVDRLATAANEAIRLVDNTGGPITIGTVTDPPNTSTIAGGTANAVLIRNSANVTLSNLQINNGANTVAGVKVEKSGSAAMTVNINDLEANGGNQGIYVDGTGGSASALNMTINDGDMNSSIVDGVLFDEVDSGSINVTGLTVDGNSAASSSGMQILDSNANFTIDATTMIQEVDGASFLVDGGTGTVNMAGDINNMDATGRSVVVQNRSGGAVTLTGDVDDTNGLGILVNANQSGTISFLGTYDLNTGINDAVQLTTNNNNATISFTGLNIDTTSGRGFVATGGGNLAISGTTNTIDTTTGRGLVMDGMVISNAGANFQSINVNGADNGIRLENLTGGQLAIGNAGAGDDSGGTITTVGGDAIVLTNVQNVDLRNIRIASAGGVGLNVTHNNAGTTAMDVTVDNLNLDASTGNGVQVNGQSDSQTTVMRFTNGDLEENFVTSVTGAALFQLRVDDTSIDVGATDAFSFAMSSGATEADLVVRRADFLATNASAARIDLSGGTGKTLDLLIEDGVFDNNSASALNAAVDITSQDSSTLNGTIQGNAFDNSNGAAAASDFTMTADGVGARIRLNLGGDGADFNDANGSGVYNLVEVPGGADFDVFEKTDLFGNLRNNGTVSPQSPAGVANPGAFDDLPVAPTPPVIP